MAQIPERAPNVEGRLEADPDVSLLRLNTCLRNGPLTDDKVLRWVRLQPWRRGVRSLLTVVNDPLEGRLKNEYRSRYTASLTSSIERYPIENGRR